MSAPFGVLFVCTANICRSPTAEAVFAALVGRAGLGDRIVCDSAGTWDGFVGEPPDADARAIAADRGFDLSGLRARRVGPKDYERFDLLLAMEQAHLVRMRAECPAQWHSKLRHFMDYATDERDVDMPDPYGGDRRGFELVLDLAQVGCQALLDEIRTRRF